MFVLHLCTEMGERVGPRLREFASRGWRKLEGGIHATPVSVSKYSGMEGALWNLGVFFIVLINQFRLRRAWLYSTCVSKPMSAAAIALTHECLFLPAPTKSIPSARLPRIPFAST